MTLEAGPCERLEWLFHADFAVVLALIHPDDRGVTLKVEKCGFLYAFGISLAVAKHLTHLRDSALKLERAAASSRRIILRGI